MNNCKNIPDLTGKVAIVTGANSGTGYGISYHLAKHGCKVIMASRNLNKLQQAREDLLAEVPGAELDIAELDITRMTSVQNFAERINSDYRKIDFLANNAGAGNYKYIQTEDGLEENLTINYLGHVALTTRLLPVLKNSSRIVNFSSIGYKKLLKNDLDVDNLMCTDESQYDQMQEYCKAKLCAILYSFRLQQEFEARGIDSKVFACHPGNARTDLMKKDNTTPFIRFVFGYFLAPLMKVTGMSHSLYDGALPAIEALIADDAQTGKVYAPGNKNELTGDPIAWGVDNTHFNEEDIEKLWIKTQKILKLSFDEYL